MTLPTVLHTRVAPSPTGEAHVGTAYVALFNRAAAKNSGGSFTLRVEDTDSKRTVEGAETRLTQALEWLGLTPDASPSKGGPHGPYRQSERLALYREAAWKLVDAGVAYPSFETSEELTALRDQMQQTGEHILRLPSREIDPETAKARAKSGEKHVIRLKAPLEGTVTIQDLVRGDVTFNCSEIDDKVLIKEDGGATYHMAATFDDRAMGINLVVRAEEWLTSTPVHVMLHQAMSDLGIGQTEGVPAFAHLPLLRNAGGSKISKRKNPTGIDWYRREGILPDALLEFLATMGWGGAENKTLKEIQESFNILQVRAGAPVFDLTRLKAHNAKRMQELDTPGLREHLRAWGAHVNENVSKVCALPNLTALARRSQTLSELFVMASNLLTQPEITPQAPWAERALRVAANSLSEQPTEQELVNQLREVSAEENISLKQICGAVRRALCGSEQGPGITELAATLGLKEALNRLSVKQSVNRQEAQGEQCMV